MSLINKSIKNLEDSAKRLKTTATNYNAKIIDQVLQEEKQRLKRLISKPTNLS